MVVEIIVAEKSRRRINSNFSKPVDVSKIGQMEDLLSVLSQEINEPSTHVKLKQLLVSEYAHLLAIQDMPKKDIKSIFGNIFSEKDKERSINLLSSGSRRAISTFIGGRVGGFIFSASHKDTVEEMIKIKSGTGIGRQKLFAIVSTAGVIRDVVDNSMIGNAKFENLAGTCFVQMPITPSAHEFLPSEVVSVDESGKDMAQFFMPEVNSPLENLVERVLAKDPRNILAGTSANYSNFPSLTNRVHTAIFSLHHGILYLDHPGIEDKSQRGSYSIVKIDKKGVLTQSRLGHFDRNYLQKLLSG